jgi:hypothetical protein
MRMKPAEPPEGSVVPLRQAQALVDAEAAKFIRTGNPVFAWTAIEAATAPVLAPFQIVLPDAIREYLHTAGRDIWMAASGPPRRFPPSVLAALRIAEGKNGKSVPREYAKLHSLAALLGVYDELKARHGNAERAHEQIAAALNLASTRTVEARVTDARKVLSRSLESGAQPFTDLDQRELGKFSEEQLLRFLKAMPYVRWKGQSAKQAAPQAMASAKKPPRRSGKVA